MAHPPSASLDFLSRCLEIETFTDTIKVDTNIQMYIEFIDETLPSSSPYLLH